MATTPQDPAGAQLATPLRRSDLEKYPHFVVKNEEQADLEPSVAVYELPEGRVILKEWRPARGRLLRRWSRWIIQREIRHYRLLQGTRGVPRLLSDLEDGGFLIEYVDGKPISRRMPIELLRKALESLARVLDDLHARRFAHLDVRHRGNVLVDASGQAWIIDLAQGVDCSRGLLRRLLFPIFRRIDRSSIVKFRARYAPQTLDPVHRERLVAKHAHRKPGLVPSLGRRLLSFLQRTS